MSAENARLEEARENKAAWKKWGPYLSERQWGTVREDYSEGGDAWNYFSHDQARLLPASKLGRAVSSPLDALRRHLRIQLKRLPVDLHSRRITQQLHRLLQPPLADEAPGADHV